MTATDKGKTNEDSMKRIIQHTLPGDTKLTRDQKVLYLVDGAPSHTHASVASELNKLGFTLYISPPDCTPYAQACDKTRVNKNFQKNMVELYTTWVNESVTEEQLSSAEPIKLSNPSRRLFGQWVLASWQKIPDSALIDAMRAAYFPGGMLVSDLLPPPVRSGPADATATLSTVDADGSNRVIMACPT
jgi:hypothetical protein